MNAAAVRNARAQLDGHYPCNTCSSAGGAGGMCAEGLRRYAAFLAALAQERGADPARFPSVRVARARRLA